MCGLFFVLQRDRPIDRAQFDRASGTLAHRGPDFHATVFDSFRIAGEDGPVDIAMGAGHHRLAILDLDARSNQPFRRNGRTLVYNGEIYNFAELKRDPELVGVAFTTCGDTEVLFEALGRGGAASLARMNGMWAFAYFEEATGRLIAGRDRYGKKPLFTYLDDRTLCLSSSIGAILGYLGRRPKLRAESLDAYLAHGLMWPGDGAETYIEGVGQVPPGHVLRFDARSWTATLEAYVNAAAIAETGPAPSDDLPEILREAVVSRLVSDRQVGLLLSGGVDSSLILSVLSAAGLQDGVRCFIGDTGASQDAAYAKACVAELGVSAEVIDLGYRSDSLDRFLRMCRHHEKPFPLIGNSMAMAEMYEKVAEQDVPVVLDGTGGDEIFGGYFDRTYPFALREALATGDLAWAVGSARELGFSTIRWALAAALLGQSRSTPRLLARGGPRSPDPLAGFRGSFTDALVADATRGRLGEWLWHNDRNAMMSGIENRSPLLDSRLIPFLGSGYRSKFVGPWNKHELRQAFSSFRPLPTQWRREKQGFRWMRRRFLDENKPRILELIAASECLRPRADIPAFLDRARRSDRAYRSASTQRYLSIAGLETAIGLQPS